MRSVLSRCSLVAMVVFLFAVCFAAHSAAAPPQAIIKNFPGNNSQQVMLPAIPGPGAKHVKLAAGPKQPPGSPAGLKLPSQADWIMGYTRAGVNAYRSIKGMRNGVPRRGTPRGKYPAYPGYTGPYYPRQHPRNPWLPDPDAWDHHGPVGSPPTPQAPPENPWPITADRPGSIHEIDASFDRSRASAIVNPKENGVVLRYVLDGKEIELPPGHYQNLGLGHAWTVEFDRGGSLGKHRYSITNGLFEFTPTSEGWQLFQQKSN